MRPVQTYSVWSKGQSNKWELASSKPRNLGLVPTQTLTYILMGVLS